MNYWQLANGLHAAHITSGTRLGSRNIVGAGCTVGPAVNGVDGRTHVGSEGVTAVHSEADAAAMATIHASRLAFMQDLLPRYNHVLPASS